MAKYRILTAQEVFRLVAKGTARGGYTEGEKILFLFTMQRGRCAWCKSNLNPDGRSIRIARNELRDDEDRWQFHHHPDKSSREKVFGEYWKQVYPERPLNMRLICLKCHDYPHGSKYRPRPIDPLL